MPEAPRVPRAGALLLALVATTAPTEGQLAPPPPGADVPAGAWPTADGPPCGSRAVATTRPLRHRPELAWRFEVEGSIEGEPLVWDDLVVVVEHRDDDQRFLHLLDLADGRPRMSPRPVKTSARLDAALWGRHLAIRLDDHTIRTYEISQRLLQARDRWEFDGLVGPPLIYGREVYFVAGDDLVRCDLHRREPIWTAGNAAAGVRQRPSLRDVHVYAVQRGPRSGTLVAVPRDEPSQVTKASLGAFAAGWPQASIALGHDRIAVSCTDPSVLSQANSANVLLLTRQRLPVLGFGTGQPSSSPVPYLLLDAPTVDEAVALGMPSFPGRGLAWATPRDEGFRLLTDDRVHGAWHRDPIPPTAAGSVVMIGHRAFDAVSNRVLWILDTQFVGPAIPGNRRVLGRVSDKVLAAFGPPLVEADVAGRWTKTDTLLDGAVVLADGSVQPGDAIVDRSDGSLRLGKTTCSAEDWLGLLDGTGAVVALPDPERIGSFVAAVTEARLRTRCLELLPDAIRAKDPRVLGLVLARARGLSAADEELTVAEKALQRLDSPRNRPLKNKAAEVEEALDRLDDATPEIVGRLLEDLDELPAAHRIELLAAATRTSPGLARVDAGIRALLPEEVRGIDPLDPIEWLDFARTATEIPFEVVEPAAETDLEASPVQRELSRLQRVWRKDLFAVESEHLFVVSPIDRPGTLARCLSLGELVCDELDRMFAGGEAVRDTSVPLRILLYSSKEEYLQVPDLEARSRAPEPSHLSWTAGHYAARDGVSRMFLPDDEAGFERVADVFAHELTHHWLDLRCPRYTLAQRRRADPNAPGYWIVEGFAELLGNAEFDLARRRVKLVDPFDPNLDTVASTKDRQRIAWPDLFGASHAAMLRSLDPKPGSAGDVPSRFRLAVRGQLSQINLFYSQAAAATLYLYAAEGGRHRDALLDYVERYYTCRPGEGAVMSVEKAFGVAPATLGDRVREWARSSNPTGG